MKHILLGTYELDIDDTRLIMKRAGQCKFKLNWIGNSSCGNALTEVWTADDLSDEGLESLDEYLYECALAAKGE